MIEETLVESCDSSLVAWLAHKLLALPYDPSCCFSLSARMIAVYCRKNFSFAVHILSFNKSLKPEFWSSLRSQSQLGDGKTFLVDASGTILSAIHIQEKKKTRFNDDVDRFNVQRMGFETDSHGYLQNSIQTGLVKMFFHRSESSLPF